MRYPPAPPGPVSNPQPRPAGFAAIAATLAARAPGDSVDDMSAENVSEAREPRPGRLDKGRKNCSHICKPYSTDPLPSVLILFKRTVSSSQLSHRL